MHKVWYRRLCFSHEPNFSKAAADWHELMTVWQIVHYPMLAPMNNLLINLIGRAMQPADVPPPQSTILDLHPVAQHLLRYLFLIPLWVRGRIYLSSQKKR